VSFLIDVDAKVHPRGCHLCVLKAPPSFQLVKSSDQAASFGMFLNPIICYCYFCICEDRWSLNFCYILSVNKYWLQFPSLDTKCKKKQYESVTHLTFIECHQFYMDYNLVICQRRTIFATAAINNRDQIWITATPASNFLSLHQLGWSLHLECGVFKYY
jgi:hypothetical protein